MPTQPALWRTCNVPKLVCSKSPMTSLGCRTVCPSSTISGNVLTFWANSTTLKVFNAITLVFNFYQLPYRYNPDMLPQANAAVANTFGSLYQRVRPVIYTNGFIDPWYTHGITYSDQPDTFVYNINRNLFVFHCIPFYCIVFCLDMARSSDLWSIRPQDPAGLNQVKAAIRDQLILWSRV